MTTFCAWFLSYQHGGWCDIWHNSSWCFIMVHRYFCKGACLFGEKYNIKRNKKLSPAIYNMIRLENFSRLRCGLIMLCSAMLFAVVGCNRAYVEEDHTDPSEPALKTPVYMASSIAVRALRSELASGSLEAEDEIAQLRILVFNSATGKLAINKFYGSSERASFMNQPANVAAAWRGAFQIVPDKYDFYFIANEDSWPETKTALEALTVGVAHVSDLYSKDFAMRIPYAGSTTAQNKTNRTFYPSVTSGGTTTNGHLFLATRVYKNVDVQATRNGKGASPADPQHFLAEGDEKVELIRTLSKVKLTIPNSATAESDGAGGYRIKQFLPSRIQRILLKNERPYQSLFLNPFLESNTFTPGKKYADDWYTKPTDAAKDYVLYDRSLTTNANETGLSVGVGAEVTVPAGTPFDANRRYDCTIWFYVPEHLRQALSTDPATPGMVDGASGLVFEKIGVSGESSFGIWQQDLTEGKQMVYDNGASSLYYVLPNVAAYSKYSVVRNHVYDIKVRYAGAQLMLHYKVLPWQNGGHSGVYVMDAFNVSSSDPSFKNEYTDIIMSTTSQTLATGESIELRAEEDFTFVDNGVETSSVTYGTTAAERVFRSYRTVKIKANTYPVADGTTIFGVYSNGQLLYTVNAFAQ